MSIRTHSWDISRPPSFIWVGELKTISMPLPRTDLRIGATTHSICIHSCGMGEISRSIPNLTLAILSRSGYLYITLLFFCSFLFSLSMSISVENIRTSFIYRFLFVFVYFLPFFCFLCFVNKLKVRKKSSYFAFLPFSFKNIFNINLDWR